MQVRVAPTFLIIPFDIHCEEKDLNPRLVFSFWKHQLRAMAPSQLVSLAEDGITLHYDTYENRSGPTDNPITGGSTNKVPDYSMAGYMGKQIIINGKDCNRHHTH